MSRGAERLAADAPRGVESGCSRGWGAGGERSSRREEAGRGRPEESPSPSPEKGTHRDPDLYEGLGSPSPEKGRTSPELLTFKELCGPIPSGETEQGGRARWRERTTVVRRGTDV
jgi:hypothetical protein